MKFILQLIVSTLAVLITAYLLSPHVAIRDNNFFIALLVALVLAFLNAVVKPIMIVLTIPVTIFSFGLFLLVINALIIMLASKIVSGFHVDGFWWALLFSLILSLTTSLLESVKQREDNRNSDNY